MESVWVLTKSTLTNWILLQIKKTWYVLSFTTNRLKLFKILKINNLTLTFIFIALGTTLCGPYHPGCRNEWVKARFVQQSLSWLNVDIVSNNNNIIFQHPLMMIQEFATEWSSCLSEIPVLNIFVLHMGFLCISAYVIINYFGLLWGNWCFMRQLA